MRSVWGGWWTWGKRQTLSPLHLVPHTLRADFRDTYGVEISGERLGFNMTRWPVYAVGREVGFVTSVVYSPRLEKNIGYAYVPTEFSGLGTELAVDVPGDERRSATVVRKPFVDPEKDIPKS